MGDVSTLASRKPSSARSRHRREAVIGVCTINPCSFPGGHPSQDGGDDISGSGPPCRRGPQGPVRLASRPALLVVEGTLRLNRHRRRCPNTSDVPRLPQPSSSWPKYAPTTFGRFVHARRRRPRSSRRRPRSPSVPKTTTSASSASTTSPWWSGEQLAVSGGLREEGVLEPCFAANNMEDLLLKNLLLTTYHLLLKNSLLTAMILPTCYLLLTAYTYYLPLAY